jgi:hypothetical protein
MALSFPYPTLGTTKRPAGQGCLNCVHRNYCQAFYWYYRYEQFPSESGKPGKQVDQYLGVACNSYSSNPTDQIKTANADDLAENDRLNDEGILVEPFREGITDPVTANDHEQ